MSLAHRLAIASDLVTADMVSAGEFPHLANRYAVYGVPKTVVNENIQFEGSRPEADVVQQLMKVEASRGYSEKDEPSA